MNGLIADLNAAAGNAQVFNPETGDTTTISVDQINQYRNALAEEQSGGLVAGLTANANAGANAINQPGEGYARNHMWAQNAYEKMAEPRSYKIDEVEQKVDKEAPYSVINKWSLFSYKGKMLDSAPTTSGNEPAPIWGVGKELYRKPLYTAESDELNPTAGKIIQKCSQSAAVGYQYSSSDFAYCQYYGKIPNNYMVTLRRFPLPCPDDIINGTVLDATGQAKKVAQADLARAITWMSEAAGNKMDEILKFTVGYEWDDLVSEVQTITPQQPDRGSVGNFINSSPFLSNVENTANGVSPYQAANVEAHGAGWDPLKETKPNQALGPYNVIKNVRVRKEGLTYEQDLKLTFEYNLRSIGKVDPKMAMLDILANMLVLTYNNAPFWGGAVRYTSSGTVKKPFGDMSKLYGGDIQGYFKSLTDGFAEATKGIFSGNPLEGLKKIGQNLLGGSLMNLFGKPSGTEAAKAFLTGDPTGAWHVTIGNPLNPIAVMGNLTCTNAEFNFEGPLGYEDFPSKLKVVITLQPGRYRDKGDIESMFNAGRGRIYLTPQGARDPNQETIVDGYGQRIRQRGVDVASGRGASNFRGGNSTGANQVEQITISNEGWNDNGFVQSMKDFANG